MSGGLIVAASASGGGKTVLTLGLLRRLSDLGERVFPAKTGPDYIDPAFHAAAARTPCYNLDTWAMDPATLDALLSYMQGQGPVVAEGVMGLFDGAPAGASDNKDGSTASLAARTGWPVVLVLDVRGQAASAAAVLRGFATHRPDVTVAGVILNRVAGDKHARTLRRACEAIAPVLGIVPEQVGLSLPSRHLGLVQAMETDGLESILTHAAQVAAEHLDIPALQRLMGPGGGGGGPLPLLLPPLGQRIAVARDAAFAFAYPAVLDGWRSAGAEVSVFSPLDDQAPDPKADAVFLPGGYPELHAGRLAGNAQFLDGVRSAARKGAKVYGECGGYMVLGHSLTDANGQAHAMAGLLPLDTSFAQRRLHLGYRQARLLGEGVLGMAGKAFRGHEFHYATTLSTGAAQPLFAVSDAEGTDLGSTGLVVENVCGSFIHLIS